MKDLCLCHLWKAQLEQVLELTNSLFASFHTQGEIMTDLGDIYIINFSVNLITSLFVLNALLLPNWIDVAVGT